MPKFGKLIEQMREEIEEKFEAIRNHYYSSQLPLKSFYKEFHTTYGYALPKGLKDAMIRNNITMKARTEFLMNNKVPKKVQIKEFDISEVTDFGIQKSIGQEYLSAKLPDHLKKIGVLSDIHFPFHSMDALLCAIKYLREERIDCLYLNGDIFDFYSISRHEKDKDLRDLAREVDMCRDFVHKLREIFSDIPIYYKLGNHEDRYARSLQVQAEEFSQLHDLQFDVFFHLDRLKFEVIDSWRGMEMGNLLVLHGHELYGGGGVNPSQNLFQKVLCNTLIGHVHRTSSTTRKTGFKEYIHTYSTGCLTALSPKYMPFSQHNHGFALVEIENGKSKVKNIVIKDGKII
jgi:predicted phosphodiesterase